MSRRSLVLVVTRPKFALVGSAKPAPPPVTVPVCALPRFGRFGKLKNSARNCSLLVPARLTFLNSAMSHCAWPGLYSRLRGALPNVPAAGATKAAGLNQKLLSSPAPAENVGVVPDFG